jgi:hypothetical protein
MLEECAVLTLDAYYKKGSEVNMEPVSQDDIQAMRANGYDPATIREEEARLRRFEQGMVIAEQIRAAFADVTLGDGVGMQESRGKDDYEDDETLVRYRSYDEKEDWERIPSSELNSGAGGLCFFDAEGMRFHLPAYLIADLRGEYHFGMTFTLTHLTDHSVTQFELLNESQRGAVRAFLLHIREDPDYEFDRDDIDRALASYWTEDGSQPAGECSAGESMRRARHYE